MLSLCGATLDLDGIPLPKNSQQAMKYGRNTSRNATASGRYSIGLGDDTDAKTFEAEETSGDVFEDLTYDYDAETFVQRNEH
ncbi:hypothetical protein Syun_023186 [Stephania yunnanensis]|uniref:Uncharacterized protein n=1 Tax=Stephania yunnanensis TaxID=152371 RepID=A0AAP0I3B5_9MAGN